MYHLVNQCVVCNNFPLIYPQKFIKIRLAYCEHKMMKMKHYVTQESQCDKTRSLINCLTRKIYIDKKIVNGLRIVFLWDMYTYLCLCVDVKNLHFCTMCMITFKQLLAGWINILRTFFVNFRL